MQESGTKPAADCCVRYNMWLRGIYSLEKSDKIVKKKKAAATYIQ